jgi:hypothetical protein
MTICHAIIAFPWPSTLWQIYAARLPQAWRSAENFLEILSRIPLRLSRAVAAQLSGLCATINHR